MWWIRSNAVRLFRNHICSRPWSYFNTSIVYPVHLWSGCHPSSHTTTFTNLNDNTFFRSDFLRTFEPHVYTKPPDLPFAVLLSLIRSHFKALWADAAQTEGRSGVNSSWTGMHWYIDAVGTVSASPHTLSMPTTNITLSLIELPLPLNSTRWLPMQLYLLIICDAQQETYRLRLAGPWRSPSRCIRIQNAMPKAIDPIASSTQTLLRNRHAQPILCIVKLAM